MTSRGKKFLGAEEKVSALSPRTLKEAVSAIIKSAYAKFDETISVDITLGIDPTKGDQVVRGSAQLPHGTGKRAVVIAFVKDDYEQEARKAGADFVGYDDLIEKILGGWLDFDYAIATPDVMAGLSRLAKVLGPRGLMPNKKTGTVSFDIAELVSELKKGRVAFKNDRGGGLHVPFGKISFGEKKLEENLVALLKAIVASRPATARGKFIRKVVMSSTQGVGVVIAPEEVLSASGVM